MTKMSGCQIRRIVVGLEMPLGKTQELTASFDINRL
jgi:hypothetical protein